MMEYLSVSVFVLMAFSTTGWAQWQGGVAVPDPRTIRISVENPLDMPPAISAPQAPLNTPEGQAQAQGQAQPPQQVNSPGNQASPSGNHQGFAPSNFFNQLSSFMFDSDFIQDKICGVSRRAMRMGGNNHQSFWQIALMRMNLFTCSCRMGEGIEMEGVDPSPQARRDCMTPFTRLICCRT